MIRIPFFSGGPSGAIGNADSFIITETTTDPFSLSLRRIAIDASARRSRRKPRVLLFAFPEATGQYSTQFTLRERVDSPRYYIRTTYASNNTRDTYIIIYKMYRYTYTYNGKHVYTHTYTYIYIYIFLQIMEDNISPLSTALNKNKTIAITHV